MALITSTLPAGGRRLVGREEDAGEEHDGDGVRDAEVLPAAGGAVPQYGGTAVTVQLHAATMALTNSCHRIMDRNGYVELPGSDGGGRLDLWVPGPHVELAS